MMCVEPRPLGMCGIPQLKFACLQALRLLLVASEALEINE